MTIFRITIELGVHMPSSELWHPPEPPTVDRMKGWVNTTLKAYFKRKREALQRGYQVDGREKFILEAWDGEKESFYFIFSETRRLGEEESKFITNMIELALVNCKNGLDS